MPTAYSYIRFSTPEQSTGDSLNRQLLGTRQYCEEHDLVLSDKSFQDLGISGFKDIQRPQLEDMLTAVKNGEIKAGDYIILEQLDRLSRQGFRKTYEVLSEIVDRDVIIVSLHDGLTLTKRSLNELVDVIRIALASDLAHQESKKRASRISHAWQEKHRKAETEKLPKTSRIPAWLTLAEDRRSFLIVEEKARVVRRIFELAADGIGQRKIAEMLNLEGVPTLTRNSGARAGKIWYSSTIKKILANGTAIGRFTPTRMKAGKRVPDHLNAIEDYYPPIVTTEQYLQAQYHRQKNRSGGGRRGKAFTNLLQKAAFCTTCGSTMRYINKGKPSERYLACNQGALGACSHKTLFNYPLVELALLNALHLLDLSQLIPSETTDKTREELARLNTRLESLDVQINELLEAKHVPQVAAKVTALGEEQEACLNKRESLLVELSQTGNPENQHAALQELLKKCQEMTDNTARAKLNSFIRQNLRLRCSTEQRSKFIYVTHIYHQFNTSFVYFELEPNVLTVRSYEDQEVARAEHKGDGVYTLEWFDAKAAADTREKPLVVESKYGKLETMPFFAQEDHTWD